MRHRSQDALCMPGVQASGRWVLARKAEDPKHPPCVSSWACYERITNYNMLFAIERALLCATGPSTCLLCILSSDPHPTLWDDVTNYMFLMRKLSLRNIQVSWQWMMELLKVSWASSDAVRIQTRDGLTPKPRFVLDARVWAYRCHIAMAKWRADADPEIKAVWLASRRGDVSPSGRCQVSHSRSQRGERVHTHPDGFWVKHPSCLLMLFLHPGLSS